MPAVPFSVMPIFIVNHFFIPLFLSVLSMLPKFLFFRKHPGRFFIAGDFQAGPNMI